MAIKKKSFYRDAEVTLREVCLKKKNRKLLLLFEDRILTDCNDENKSPEQCTEEISSLENVDSVYKQKNDSSIVKQFTWLLDVENLYQHCNGVKSRNRNQIIYQHRQW